MNSKFIIGRYIYCTQERFLYLDGESINIEPKMADVLDYLLLNTERYVPLQELHDEVWVGRIVTDTAVRRVVSRLRALIEADPSQPEIIKSLPKRGYRLFSMPASAEFASKHLEASPVEPPFISSPFEPTTVPINDVDTDVTEQVKSSTVEKIDAKEAISFPAEKNNYKGLMLIIGLVLLCCLGAFYFLKQPNNLEPHVDKTEFQATELVLSHFDTLPLNSRLLAISKNGELAFYEQNREDGSYDLFLHKIKQGKQWSIANNLISAGYADFVENDTAILFSFNSGTATEGSLQLWHLNEVNQVSRQRLLISDIQGTTSIILGEQPNSAFVSITTLVDEKARSEYQFISWDEDTLIEKKQITSTYNGQSMDIYGSLSADYQYLAYLRKTRLDHEQEIQILELATGKITKRIPWRQQTRALVWQDVETLLVLNKQNITSINIDTDNKTELFVHLYGYFWQMYLLNNKIYIYKREPQTRRYTELAIVDGVTHNIRRERPSNSVSINISKYNNQEWYEVTKEGDKYYLVLINLDNPEQGKRLFYSEEYFILMDQSLSGNILLKVGDRVGVLKPNGEIAFINSEQQILDDAVFDRDGVNIIYSQSNDNSWSINLFDVKSKKSKFIRQGYKGARVSDELYVFWREDGELFKAKNLTGELQPLSVKANLFFPPIWGVAYPDLYWLDFFLGQLVLYKFNLETNSKELVETDFINGLEFNINKNGEQLIIDGFSDATSEIYIIDSKEKNKSGNGFVM
ncbi:winged helix-turn-helix domain-containing protein [Shewanella sp. SR44-3]|nr:winged helix-turn-helix domain-containing protein [Shewanella sp. SR44-3]